MWDVLLELVSDVLIGLSVGSISEKEEPGFGVTLTKTKSSSDAFENLRNEANLKHKKEYKSNNSIVISANGVKHQTLEEKAVSDKKVEEYKLRREMEKNAKPNWPPKTSKNNFSNNKPKPKADGKLVISANGVRTIYANGDSKMDERVQPNVSEVKNEKIEGIPSLSEVLVYANEDVFVYNSEFNASKNIVVTKKDDTSSNKVEVKETKDEPSKIDEYDERGFNSKGIHRNGTKRDNDGFDVEGYSIFGYDREGYDRNGYNRLGYNKEGYDRDGYDKNGYNKDGIDRYGKQR